MNVVNVDIVVIAVDVIFVVAFRWKKVEMLSNVYGLTKIFKAGLWSLEKTKTIWGTETIWRDLSIETDQKFVASAV